jgi:hypothetical protein
MIGECGEGAKAHDLPSRMPLVLLRKACRPVHVIHALAWQPVGFAQGVP